MISRRQEFFFHHRLSACKFFPPLWLCKQFFLDAPLGQTIYFSIFSHADNFFFPITIPPPRGGNNGPSLSDVDLITQMRIIVASEDNRKNKIAAAAAEIKSILSMKPKEQVKTKSVDVDSVQTQAKDKATANGADILHAIEQLKSK